MSPTNDQDRALITRREAVWRVSALLGGAALVGGSGLLAACNRADEAARDTAAAAGTGSFSTQDIAFLDEVADTILPTTSTPGAKAAWTGAFMALMVTDTYGEPEQRAFRDGMRTLDEECRKANNAGFMQATPQQRLALLERLDREQMDYMQRRAAAGRAPAAAQEEEEKKADANLSDQRKQNAAGGDDAAAPAITADAPPHYFRMMKELALLGYFTSEIGYTQAMRYEETPGRFDPCVPYAPGDKAWAPHA